VVLVAGQVESDASIRHGSPELRTNLELLQAVRAAEPGAWIVYKPHPDVVAGLRREGSPLAELKLCCDALLTEGCMDRLYQQVDAVHVLTSLAGFEALLRGVEVHTWGLPFFAGWGLSHDRLACPRRGRQLQLDELVYGALVAYPRYVSRHSGLFIEPEHAIEELLEWSREPPRAPTLWRRLFRHWGRWK
jgi:capsular polysaccharide export protein